MNHHLLVFFGRCHYTDICPPALSSGQHMVKPCWNIAYVINLYHMLTDRNRLQYLTQLESLWAWRPTPRHRLRRGRGRPQLKREPWNENQKKHCFILMRKKCFVCNKIQLKCIRSGLWAVIAVIISYMFQKDTLKTTHDHDISWHIPKEHGRWGFQGDFTHSKHFDWSEARSRPSALQILTSQGPMGRGPWDSTPGHVKPKKFNNDVEYSYIF